MSTSALQPSVLHLVTIFRQITSGEIRIPAFQRTFIWKEKQILALLESVLQGYPIGSLLLWSVDRPILNTAPFEVTAFPDVSERFPTTYVLDGMQRLSTLYGVFHFGASTQDKRFNVYYDLEEGEFFQRDDAEEVGAAAFPLAALFVPRRLLEHQAQISQHPKSDLLIERLLALQAAFQDYMIPVVTIRSTDVSRIVKIFEKINSTGTPLDPVDFMRAITWAEDFDLNRSLDAATAELSDIDFQLSAETIVKCVGMSLGIPPTTDGLLDLRIRQPKQLKIAFAKAVEGLKRTAKFLSDNFSIQSSAFVPYEGQMLLLFKTIGLREASAADVPGIIRWYWAIGFNEGLRGKPDHYVVRAVEKWQLLISGKIRGLEPRLRLEWADLAERRLVSKAALSSTFVTMYAANGARSLQTGKVVNTKTYMGSLDLGWFEPVFTRSELIEAGYDDLISARLFGNIVLLDEETLSKFGVNNLKAALVEAAKRKDWATLRSQFVDQGVLAALQNNDGRAFIECRAELMFGKASQLVAGGID